MLTRNYMYIVPKSVPLPMISGAGFEMNEPHLKVVKFVT